MTKKQHTLFWNGIFILVVVLIVGSIYYSTTKVAYNWRWERVPQYIVYTAEKEFRAPAKGTVQIQNGSVTITTVDGQKVPVATEGEIQVADGKLVFEGDVLAVKKSTEIGPLLLGLWVTLKISFMSIIFAVVIGIFTGLMRVSRNPALKNLALLYVEIIRGTPLLVQIFIFYFFIGTVLQLDRMTAGVAALAIFAGAYIAEIVRAGIQSIAKGQTEAARSLGMNYSQTMRYVILPQALKRTLPPMAGQFISLIKDSSLVSVIAITDLSMAGRQIVTTTFSSFEVWFTVALMYLALTSGLSYLVNRIERRLAASD